MTPVNVLAYLAQIAVVVIACAGVPRLLGLRSPAVQYLFWRVVLLVCLALPLIQPWRPVTAAFEAFALGAVTPSAVPFVNKITTEASSRPIYALTFNPLFVGTIVVMAGCAVRLLWIGIGIARLRSLRRAPATEPADGFEDLSAAVGVSVPILWSPRVRHPVTFGLRRPVILLPVALKSVDPGAQRAVVAHELHHVVRRDWAWLVAEEILRAVFWFHPAMWWLISRVQLARETVVDELSILVTNARRTYLDALVAFADDTGLGSPAFSARRHLFHRVMLLSKEGEMSSRRVAIGSGLLVVALGAGTWGAASAFPLHEESARPAPTAAAPSQDAPQPPRDQVFQGHRISVDFEDADVRAVLGVLAKATSLTMIVDPRVQGRVNVLLHDVPWDQALDRILRASKLGYTVEGNTLRIAPLETLGGMQRQTQKDSLRALAAREAKMLPPPPPPPMLVTASDGSTSVVVPSPAAPMLVAPSAAYAAALAAYDPVRIGGEIKSPAKIRDVKPAYPAEARAAGVQGVIVVEILVDPAGDVVDAQVLRSVPMLNEAALDAVRQWRFTPTIVNGEPRSVLLTVTVSFRMQ